MWPRCSLCLVLTAVAAGCASESSVPEIHYVAPSAVAAGAELQIVGMNLCGEQAEVSAGDCVDPPPGTVNFGANVQVVRGNTLSWRDERISVAVPLEVLPGAGVLTVSIDGVVTEPVTLTVLE